MLQRRQTDWGKCGGARKWLPLVLAVAILVLAGLPVAWVYWYRADRETQLADKLAELEEAGVTVSLEDVHRRYHEHGRDPAGNAAAVYEKAFDELITDEGPWEAVEDLFDSLPPDAERLEKIEELVDANREAIRLFKQAASREFVRFDLDFREGTDLLIPHVGEIRNGARLLAGEAIVAAESADVERTEEAITAIFRMAIQLAEEPILISQLTRIALEGIGRSTLEHVLDRIEPQPAFLAATREKLRLSETGPRLEAGISSEIAYGNWIFERVEEVGPIALDEEPEKWERAFFAMYRTAGLLAKDQYIYLTRMENIRQMTLLPFEERVGLEWEADDFSVHPFDGEIVSSIIAPTVFRVIESDIRAVTYLRAGRIALAAEEYRLDNGEFPSSQQDLAPRYLEELPSDPYAEDGRFRLVSESDGFFVRSQGVIEAREDRDERPIQFRLAR